MLFKKRPYHENTGVSLFTKSDRRRRMREIIIIVAIVVIVTAIYTFENRIMDFGADMEVSNSVVLYILSLLMLLLLVLMIFLILRNIIKLLYDRRRRVLGSKLRIRLVISFVTLSLLPTIVLFIFSVNFISKSIEHWANAPVETALDRAKWVSAHYYTFIEQHSLVFLKNVEQEIKDKKIFTSNKPMDLSSYIQTIRYHFNFDGVEVYDLNGRRTFSISDRLQNEYFGTLSVQDIMKDFEKHNTLTIIQDSPSGDLIKVVYPIRLNRQSGVIDGFLVTTIILGADVINSINEVEEGISTYESFQEQKIPFQKQYIMALTIVAFVVLFCAMWVGFYLAKTISVPIKELAEGIRRVAKNNLDVSVGNVGDDEIGSLVNDFNQMIRDLRTGRYQLDMYTAQLRQQNTELEQRRQYIEIVLENVSAGVMTLNAQGYILSINKSAENILALRAEDVLKHSFTEVLGADDYKLAPESLERLVLLDTAHSLTLRLMINEQSRSLLITFTPLVDSAKKHIGVVVVFDDLTELEKGERMAAWREVARRVAHEVKNPLTPISLSAERLSRKYGRQIDDPVFAECTKVIIDHVELIRNIVNEFSNFARFPSSILSPAELVPIIEESLALYREANLNINFALQVVEKIPRLNLDVLRLKQVFINLLDNAIAAMQGQGVINITVRFNKAGDHVLILIADNGPGLSAEAKMRIFEPNFSTKATGMGLGLTIVNTIIADHKGAVEVTDNDMGGATFIISLPLN